MKKHHEKVSIQSGFTLIEVMIALVVVAIALTALLKASSQVLSNTARIKEKTIYHWIAMQGVTEIELGLVDLNPAFETTHTMQMLGGQWYWRGKLTTTAVKNMQQITITVSKNKHGPFTTPLTAFRYAPHEPS